MTRLSFGLIAVLAVTLIVLAVWPQIDLDAAEAFYVGPGHFIGNTPVLVLVRYVAWVLPFLVYLGWLMLWLVARAQGRAAHGRAVIFLSLSLALGPGLIVHAILKEISHRPRPYSVVEFGGHDAFRPYIRFDGACAHNCSFPSGETAAATWMLAPASLAPPLWRGPALAVAVIFAASVGGLRMAFGGHFLSDVSGAALITLLVILALRRLLFPPSA